MGCHPFGLPWPPQAISVGFRGPPLGPLGSSSVPRWAPLASPWTSLAPLWLPSASFWPPSGLSWLRSGFPLTTFGPLLASLGVSEAPSGPPGVILLSVPSLASNRQGKEGRARQGQVRQEKTRKGMEERISGFLRRAGCVAPCRLRSGSRVV